MSQDPTNNRPKIRFRFWPVMHITMGLFFVIIGITAATMRHFGAVQLTATWAYGFGALLILYGSFRIWRGVHDLKTTDEDSE